jgi:hypothetical protein
MSVLLRCVFLRYSLAFAISLTFVLSLLMPRLPQTRANGASDERSLLLLTASMYSCLSAFPSRCYFPGFILRKAVFYSFFLSTAFRPSFFCLIVDLFQFSLSCAAEPVTLPLIVMHFQQDRVFQLSVMLANSNLQLELYVHAFFFVEATLDLAHSSGGP